MNKLIGNQEAVTIEDVNREHRKFWSQTMEFMQLKYIGNGVWENVGSFKQDKGSEEIQ